jgi:sec-independent protein translocase protein TatB
MARQSELDELRKEVEAMRKAQAGDLAALAAAPEVQQTFNELSQGLTDVGVNLDSPTAYPYTMAQTEHVDTEAIAAAKPKRARKAAAAKPAKKTAARPAAATKRVAKAAPAKAAPAKAPKPAAKPAAKAPARKPAPKVEPAVAPARRRKSGGTVT